MPKLVNKHAGAWAGLGTLFFSVYLTFQITLLNPQMEITNGVYFPLLFKIIGLVALPTGLALYLGMALAPSRAFRIFFFFCLLVVVALPVERALHPLFLHPALVKILYKGGYAAVVLLAGFLCLKKHPWMILLLLGVGSVFLYQRRDAFHGPKGAFYAGSTGGGIPARIVCLSFSDIPGDVLWEALNEGNLPRLEEIGTHGCTGTFKVPGYFDATALNGSLLTGIYPYQTRVFGSRSNAIALLGGTDRMPFYFPPWKAVPEPKPAVPLIWDMLSARGISCGVADPPLFKPGEGHLTFYIHQGKAYPEAIRPGGEYASAVSFLFKQVRAGDSWRSRIEGELGLARQSLSPGDYLVVLVGQAGFIRLEGPGILPGQKATSMKMVDLVPTLAYLFQVPLSAEMPGRILLEAFDEEHLKTHPVGFVGRY